MAESTHGLPADVAREIEKVAVGPYCVFDAYRPPVTEAPRIATPKQHPQHKHKMEMPVISDDFGAPWLASSGDDLTFVAPSADGLAPGNWNEWMHWDPALSQPADTKSLNAPGSVCIRKPGEKSPLLDRRQSIYRPDVSAGLPPASVPASLPYQPQLNSLPMPFSFGGDVPNPPAFDFDPNGLNSSPTSQGQMNSGYYPPPVWDQPPEARDNAMFAQSFEPGLSPSHIPPVSTPSLHHSPASHNERTSSSSASPEPVLANPKKRKSSDSEESETGHAAKKDKPAPMKKTAHNMIEKRYRTNLNDKIAALRDSVPSLRVMSRPNGGNEEDDDPEDLEGLTPAHKLNKATVLSKATEYIRHLEKRNKRLTEEINTLKSRMDSYEKMAISGQLALQGSGRSPDGTRYHEDPFAHAASMVPPQMAVPQGMIPVPESMANLHRRPQPQPHYAPQHATYPAYPNNVRQGVHGPPMVNGARGNGMMGKLMVGSLAGLMILEGFSGREESFDAPPARGLFSLPVHVLAVLTPRVSFGPASAQIPLAKLLLVFGAVFYLIAPLLDFKLKTKKRPFPPVQLTRAPSLASPVEARQKAWLTAIQTVWVPRHAFWLEAAALGLKMLKLSVRKLTGWQGYAYLTGSTKEQEAARMKAWNIALDAQLTGGDAEISKSRLILTLMASATLPDTPARLMLKALHIRVLLWEFANTGYAGWRLFDDISAKLARSYWNAARSEQKIAINMASKPESEAEPLPGHLAALLDMECDDVLIPCIVQRAYNLAWNRPSAENTTVNESMDSVVEDFSISSPLDALASWWSCHALKRALAACLSSKHCKASDAAMQDLKLACSTAPPTSQAHLRALVAKAVVLDETRSEHITAALQVLPSPLAFSPLKGQSSSNSLLLNLVGDAPVATDVQIALTFAKCLSLMDSDNVEARRRATFVINNTAVPETTVTLLSFVAGYKLLDRLIQDAKLWPEVSAGLERLASSLRRWVGHESGRRSGVSRKTRGRLVGRCLEAAKLLAGLAAPDDVDDGYVTSSVKDA